jgi:2-hydroxy-3-oxopropionate reductase
VRGFDLDAAALARHETAGGTVARSVAEAVADADYVVTMLNSDEALRAVAEVPEGLLALLAPPHVHIDLGTSRVETVRDLARRFAERGVALLDAPVTGGTNGAENATLDVMVGGDRAAFDRCGALFGSFSRKVTYVGESGSGLLAKYLNQIVMTATFCAASEGLALAVKGGADPARVYEAISTGLAASPLLDWIVRTILSGDYGDGAELTLFTKDCGYVLDAARAMQAWTPITAQAHEAFKVAYGAGFGSGGGMGVARLWEQVMGVQLRPTGDDGV